MPFEVPPVFSALQGKQIPSPSPLPPHVAPAVARILHRCLAIEPSSRPEAREVIACLEEAAAA
jgi:hypothetical protein